MACRVCRGRWLGLRARALTSRTAALLALLSACSSGGPAQSSAVNVESRCRGVVLTVDRPMNEGVADADRVVMAGGVPYGPDFGASIWAFARGRIEPIHGIARIEGEILADLQAGPRGPVALVTNSAGLPVALALLSGMTWSREVISLNQSSPRATSPSPRWVLSVGGDGTRVLCYDTRCWREHAGELQPIVTLPTCVPSVVVQRHGTVTVACYPDDRSAPLRAVVIGPGGESVSHDAPAECRGHAVAGPMGIITPGFVDDMGTPTSILCGFIAARNAWVVWHLLEPRGGPAIVQLTDTEAIVVGGGPLSSERVRSDGSVSQTGLRLRGPRMGGWGAVTAEGLLIGGGTTGNHVDLLIGRSMSTTLEHWSMAAVRDCSTVAGAP